MWRPALGQILTGAPTTTVEAMTQDTKVAFATDDGSNVNQHFGRLKGFVVVTIADGAEVDRTSLPRPQSADQPGERRHNHVALLDPIAGCDTLIAGGMGLPMASHVQERGIQLLLTSIQSIDDALAGYLEGSLEHEAERAHQPQD